MNSEIYTRSEKITAVCIYVHTVINKAKAYYFLNFCHIGFKYTI